VITTEESSRDEKRWAHEVCFKLN